MNRLVKGLLVASAVLGTAFLPHAASAKKPDKVELSAESPGAVVVIKTQWWKPAPSMQSAFKLTLSTYDPDEQKLLGKPFGGSTRIEAKRKNFVDDYLIVPIKPGRWVYQAYSQQDKWTLCFNAISRQFEVKPGEVVFLGEFDAGFHRDELTLKSTMSGQIFLSQYDFAAYFDLASGPKLGEIDALQLEAVRDMLRQNAPLVTAPVRAAEYSEAKFGTGSTLFGDRQCGGYFTAGAK